jgi:beta-xylosidase
MYLFLIFTLLFSTFTSIYSYTSIVSNVVPRIDKNTGQILDIHDGTTIRIGNTFYFYGASYGGCVEQATGCASINVGECGFQMNHTVSLATSTDLQNWTLVGDILPLQNRPQGILFGPTIAQSASTNLFVLWVNILPVVNGAGDFDASFYAAFTSATPEGPFVIANPNITGIAYNRLPDSPYLFVDDDGKGYVAFTHEDTHINTVQALTPDLLTPLSPQSVSTQIGPTNNEGVVMFKRNDLYYVGFGQCCCFCQGGTNVDFYVSSSPLGPYNYSSTVITPGAWKSQTGAVWFTGVDWVLLFILRLYR